MTMTGPNLRAVDDEMIALDTRLGTQAGQIRAGVRFGEALAPDHFTPENFQQVKALLVIRPAGDERGAGMIERDETQVIVGRVGARILLVPDQLAGERQPEPAVLHGPRDARPAALELPALPRQIEAAHGLAGMRATFPDQIVAQPRTGLIAEGHVLSREMQVHYPSVSGRPRPVECTQRLIVEMIHRHLCRAQSKPPQGPAGMPLYQQNCAWAKDPPSGGFKTDSL